MEHIRKNAKAKPISQIVSEGGLADMCFSCNHRKVTLLRYIFTEHGWIATHNLASVCINRKCSFHIRIEMIKPEWRATNYRATLRAEAV